MILFSHIAILQGEVKLAFRPIGHILKYDVNSSHITIYVHKSAFCKLFLFSKVLMLPNLDLLFFHMLQLGFQFCKDVSPNEVLLSAKLPPSL